MGYFLDFAAITSLDGSFLYEWPSPLPLFKMVEWHSPAKRQTVAKSPGMW